MANLVTLATIREDIRERMQLPTFSTTTAVTSATVLRLVNKALRAYAGLRAELYGDGYQVVRDTLVTSANGAMTSLPVGAQTLLKLYWMRAAYEPVEIKPASVDGYVEHYRQPRAWDCPRYRLEGGTIVWVPVPNAAYAVEAVYTVTPADLSADGDTFDAGYEGDEWVACHVCIRLAQREKRDDDIARFTAYLVDCEQRIRAHAAQRTETDAPQVRDVSGSVLDTYALRDAITLDPFFGRR